MTAMNGPAPEAPPRPYIPPIAFMALASCATAALIMQMGWMRRGRGEVVPWIAVLTAMSVGLFAFAAPIASSSHCPRSSGPGRIVFRPSRRARLDALLRVLRAQGARGFAVASVMFAGLGILAGGAASARALWGWQQRTSWADGVVVSRCALTVRGDPHIGERGYSATVDVSGSGRAAGSCRARMTVQGEYADGDRLRAVGRFEPLGDGEWDRSRFMKGESGSLKVSSVLRCDPAAGRSPLGAVRSSALDVIDPARDAGRSLLAGTVCGRVSELSATEGYESFSRCGLTHLVAVSGGHLAYIAASLSRAMRRTRFGRALREALLFAVMGLYVLFTGGSPSALRSVCMVGMASISVLGGRRAHAPSSLFATVSVMSWLDPGVVFDVGFQLSAASVLFITVFSRQMAHILGRLGLPSALAEPLALALVAQWATLPITIPVFGEMSLIAPLANIAVGPVMSALLVTGLGAVSAGVILNGAASMLGPLVPAGALGAVADALVWVPVALAKSATFLAGLFAGIPHAAIAVAPKWWLGPVLYGAACVLYARWERVSPRRLAALLGVVCSLVAFGVARWTLFAPPSVTVLDVGQGDAILLRHGSHAVLVDAGVDEATREALARNRVFRLDALVVTHWDRDHWGGLPEFLPYVPTDALVVARGAATHAPDDVKACGLPIVEMGEGDVLRVGGFACRAVWPDAPVTGEENADSLVLDVSYGGEEGALDVLLTGDSEREELGRYAGEVGDVDVLKIGHHGSRVSVDADSLALLRPEVAIASAGEDNAYGHPDPSCVRLVSGCGARFLCTIDAGDITVVPGRGGPRMSLSYS